MIPRGLREFCGAMDGANRVEWLRPPTDEELSAGTTEWFHFRRIAECGIIVPMVSIILREGIIFGNANRE
jgi:hypothetical protein